MNPTEPQENRVRVKIPPEQWELPVGFLANGELVKLLDYQRRSHEAFVIPNLNDEQLTELVVRRLEAKPDFRVLSFGGKGAYSKEEVIAGVRAGSEIGLYMIKIETSVMNDVLRAALEAPVDESKTLRHPPERAPTDHSHRSRLLASACFEIDANWDDLTKAAYIHRNKYVYPFFPNVAGRLLGGSAVPSQVMNVPDGPSYTYLTGSGHGAEDRFKGFHQGVLIKNGHYDKRLVDGKIVHLLACRSAYSLGPDMVRNGCLAFFGYDRDFHVLEGLDYIPYQDDFLAGDSEIDLAFAEGLKAGEVHDRVVAKFKSLVAGLQTSGRPFALDVAHAVNQNQDAFKSPGSEGGIIWGSVDARLT